MVCFLASMAANANAVMTDGNYTMIQYDLAGSGNVATDGNYYFAAIDAGEPATAQNISDENYNAGIGFYGNPFAALVELVAPVKAAAEAVTTTIVAIIKQTDYSILGIILFAMLGGFMLFYVFIRKKLSTKEKPVDDNEEEFVGEEDDEESEDGGNL